MTRRRSGALAGLVALVTTATAAYGQEFGYTPKGTLRPECKLLRDDPIPLPLQFGHLEMPHVGPVAEAIRAEARRTNAAVAIPESVQTGPVDAQAARAGMTATELVVAGQPLPFKSKF